MEGIWVGYCISHTSLNEPEGAREVFVNIRKHFGYLFFILYLRVHTIDIYFLLYSVLHKALQ